MGYKSKLSHKFAGFDGIDVSYTKPSRKASRKASRKGSRKLRCSKGTVIVKGYTRADGVRVKRHCSKIGKRSSRSRSRK